MVSRAEQLPALKMGPPVSRAAKVGKAKLGKARVLRARHSPAPSRLTAKGLRPARLDAPGRRPVSSRAIARPRIRTFPAMAPTMAAPSTKC